MISMPPMLEAINAQQAILISKIWQELRYIPEYQLQEMPVFRLYGPFLTDTHFISRHGNAALS
jgi:hypothetical protein